MNPHYQVDRDRWANFSILEQMGNIASEVGRTFTAKRRGDEKVTTDALTRALDLFDATVEGLVAQKSPRTKEILRAKDQFLHALYDHPFNETEANAIEQYFMHFAIAARSQR